MEGDSTTLTRSIVNSRQVEPGTFGIRVPKVMFVSLTRKLQNLCCQQCVNKSKRLKRLNFLSKAGIFRSEYGDISK